MFLYSKTGTSRDASLRGSREGCRAKRYKNETEPTPAIEAAYARAQTKLEPKPATSIGTKRSGFEANPSAGFVNFRRGYGNMRLHGQSYHRCLAGNATGGIEYYLYDRSYEQMCAALPAAIPRLDRLRQMLFREK